MSIFILAYTMWLSGHEISSKIEFNSLSECLMEKDRIEQHYMIDASNDKYLTITCKEISK